MFSEKVLWQTELQEVPDSKFQIQDSEPQVTSRKSHILSEIVENRVIEFPISIEQSFDILTETEDFSRIVENRQENEPPTF
ncbi:MAG: hypothetical protein HC846_10975 [Blastocatellia bacterium]|nr:hypothetical protein [Blastocatellia bacterium]